MGVLYGAGILISLSVMPVEADWPFQGKSAGELNDGPSVPFLSETEHRRFVEGMKSASIVLDARIEAIQVLRVGFGAAAVPQARISLAEIEPLKGKRPEGNTFVYSGSPGSLKFGKGARVVAFLEPAKGKGEPRILRFYAASKPLLALADEIRVPAQDNAA